MGASAIGHRLAMESTNPGNQGDWSLYLLTNTLFEFPQIKLNESLTSVNQKKSSGNLFHNGLFLRVFHT